MADTGDEALLALRFVGPVTAETLRDAGITATDIERKRVSYRRLTDAGVNPGVAAKIRREHSLSWSFDADGDLERRSAQIRGLGAAERSWVAASAGEWTREADAVDDASDDDIPETDWTPGNWPGQEPVETDGDGDPAAAETAWRERSEPTPVTDIDGIDETTAATLADGGIRSVRSLATADPELVAAVLELPEERVHEWYEDARAYL